MATCTTPLVIEHSCFFMMGMAAIAVPPLLGASANVMVHRVLFSLLIIWGLGVPILTHLTFLSQAEAQGCLVPQGARVLLSGVCSLHASDCQ